MPWHNQSDDSNKKNPWGSNGGGGKGPGGKGPNNPWGGGGGSRGGGDNGDIDEMLRRAQDNFKNIFPGGMGTGKFFGLVVLVILGLWLSSGFYTIQPGVHGVIQQFGKHKDTNTQEGLAYHLPWPIEQVTKINVNEIRRIAIGFAELSSRTSSNTQDIPDESLMLTADANIVDIDLVVQWDISSAENFLFKIDNPFENIKQVAESAIREIVGQTRMFSIITNERSGVAERAKIIMQRTLDEYESGVNITQVLIQAAEVHPDVQSAFQDVQSAKQDAEERQNKAQAYSKEVIPEARGQAAQMLQEAQGYKESVIAKAKGDADRFSAILKSYRTGEEVTRERIYLETMEEIFGKTPKTIVDNQGGSGVIPFLPLDNINKKSR